VQHPVDMVCKVCTLKKICPKMAPLGKYISLSKTTELTLTKFD